MEWKETNLYLSLTVVLKGGLSIKRQHSILCRMGFVSMSQLTLSLETIAEVARLLTWSWRTG